jgi:hypothetical protein
MYIDTCLFLNEKSRASLFCRTWKVRRVAFTIRDILFAKVNGDTVLDLIPLAEIIGIESMVDQGQTTETETKIQSESAIQNTIDFSNSFQIRTRKGGFNAGRKYYFRADSEENLAEALSYTLAAAKEAARKAETRSRWALLQEQIRGVNNSDWFQGIATFLIMAVHHHPTLEHRFCPFSPMHPF